MEMRSLPPSPSKERGRIDTIYLGGGTPSQLTIPQLEQLFIYINKVYGNKAEEVTVEVNPDDVTVEFAAVLQRLPVNRVSMGAQTFDNARLRFLHRRHTAEQVPQAVQRLRDAGIRNISVDLMYGFPGETLNDWQRDIDAVLSLGVEHLSAYCLMIEEGTVLYEQMRNEKLEMNNGNEEMINDKKEELERQMYEVLIDRLAAAGYEHYEISNFARSGFRSRHNSSYWNDTPYIGLGAAAHSYDGKYRQWNVADIRQYVDAIQRGEIPCEREVIDADTHYNDRITVALRTCDGLDLDTLSDKYRSYCLREAQRFIDDGLLRCDGNHLVLTRKGLFVSDYIMSSLVYA
jgi:oxygen-independent coproporphyrinogen-3 oxidase